MVVNLRLIMVIVVVVVVVTGIDYESPTHLFALRDVSPTGCFAHGRFAPRCFTHFLELGRPG